MGCGGAIRHRGPVQPLGVAVERERENQLFFERAAEEGGAIICFRAAKVTVLAGFCPVPCRPADVVNGRNSPGQYRLRKVGLLLARQTLLLATNILPPQIPVGTLAIEVFSNCSTVPG